MAEPAVALDPPDPPPNLPSNPPSNPPTNPLSSPLTSPPASRDNSSANLFNPRMSTEDLMANYAIPVQIPTFFTPHFLERLEKLAAFSSPELAPDGYLESLKGEFMDCGIWAFREIEKLAVCKLCSDMGLPSSESEATKELVEKLESVIIDAPVKLKEVAYDLEQREYIDQLPREILERCWIDHNTVCVAKANQSNVPTQSAQTKETEPDDQSQPKCTDQADQINEPNQTAQDLEIELDNRPDDQIQEPDRAKQETQSDQQDHLGKEKAGQSEGGEAQTIVPSLSAQETEIEPDNKPDGQSQEPGETEQAAQIEEDIQSQRTDGTDLPEQAEEPYEAIEDAHIEEQDGSSEEKSDQSEDEEEQTQDEGDLSENFKSFFRVIRSEMLCKACAEAGSDNSFPDEAYDLMIEYEDLFKSPTSTIENICRMAEILDKIEKYYKIYHRDTCVLISYEDDWFESEAHSGTGMLSRSPLEDQLSDVPPSDIVSHTMEELPPTEEVEADTDSGNTLYALAPLEDQHSEIPPPATVSRTMDWLSTTDDFELPTPDDVEQGYKDMLDISEAHQEHSPSTSTRERNAHKEDSLDNSSAPALRRSSRPKKRRVNSRIVDFEDSEDEYQPSEHSSPEFRKRLRSSKVDQGNANGAEKDSESQLKLNREVLRNFWGTSGNGIAEGQSGSIAPNNSMLSVPEVQRSLPQRNPLIARSNNPQASSLPLQDPARGEVFYKNGLPMQFVGNPRRLRPVQLLKSGQGVSESQRDENTKGQDVDMDRAESPRFDIMEISRRSQPKSSPAVIELVRKEIDPDETEDEDPSYQPSAKSPPRLPRRSQPDVQRQSFNVPAPSAPQGTMGAHMLAPAAASQYRSPYPPASGSQSQFYYVPLASYINPDASHGARLRVQMQRQLAVPAPVSAAPHEASAPRLPMPAPTMSWQAQRQAPRVQMAAPPVAPRPQRQDNSQLSSTQPQFSWDAPVGEMSARPIVPNPQRQVGVQPSGSQPQFPENDPRGFSDILAGRPRQASGFGTGNLAGQRPIMQPPSHPQPQTYGQRPIAPRPAQYPQPQGATSPSVPRHPLPNSPIMQQGQGQNLQVKHYIPAPAAGPAKRPTRGRPPKNSLKIIAKPSQSYIDFSHQEQNSMGGQGQARGQNSMVGQRQSMVLAPQSQYPPPDQEPQHFWNQPAAQTSNTAPPQNQHQNQPYANQPHQPRPLLPVPPQTTMPPTHLQAALHPRPIPSQPSLLNRINQRYSSPGSRYRSRWGRPGGNRYHPRRQSSGRFLQTRGKPPPGIPPETWEEAFAAAHQMIMDHTEGNGPTKEHAAQMARLSGECRDLALDYLGEEFARRVGKGWVDDDY